MRTNRSASSCKRCTAADVARRAGVERSTVSRVLNQAFVNHRYDPRTVARIRDAAAKLGYQPSLAARSLRAGRSYMLAMVVSDIGNPFFAEMASVVESRARSRGYRTLIANTAEDGKLQAALLKDLVACGVDGVILSPSGDAGCAELKRRHVPVVTVDRPLPDHGMSYVGLDNHAAGRMLGEHLRELGYGRVTVLTSGVADDPTPDQRYAGLREGLGEGIAVTRWVAGACDVPGAIRKTMDKSRGEQAKHHAMVGLVNSCTVMALHELLEMNLAIPGDIGVAGIDDFSAATIFRPAITVVAQPLTRIAEQAVELLCDAMAGRSAEIKTRLLSPALLVRQSLQRIKPSTTLMETEQ